ncbi:glycosyltransferase family protein [Frigoribacterium salinisoli]
MAPGASDGRGRAWSIDLVVHGRDGAHPGSAYVRTLLRASWAQREGWASVRVHDAASVAAVGCAPDADLLLVQRDALLDAELATGVLDEARRRGLPVVLDVDDDLWTAPARERLVREGYSAERLAALDATTATAERVLVSTEVLAGRVPSVTASVHVVPNALDPALWGLDVLGGPSLRRPDAGLLYMGSHTHAADLDLLRGLRPRDRSSLDVLGVAVPSSAEGFRVLGFARRPVAYPALVPWLRGRAARWRAGLAPLVDDDFDAAKSDLKFLEYSALGLATVASAVPAYAAAGEHGALLVPGGADAWGEAVAELRRRPGALTERARAAREHVRRRRTFRSDDGWLGAVTGDPAPPVG